MGRAAIVLETSVKLEDINVNAPDGAGWTALQITTVFGCVKVIETLLKQRQDVDANALNKDGQTALHLAASRGNARAVGALIENGGKVDATLTDLKGTTAVDLAAAAGHEKIVDLLQAQAEHSHYSQAGGHITDIHRRSK